MVSSLLSFTLTLLNETQRLSKGKTITATLLMPMPENYTNVLVFIFALAFLDSKMPIPESMADVEHIVWVGNIFGAGNGDCGIGCNGNNGNGTRDIRYGNPKPTAAWKYIHPVD